MRNLKLNEINRVRGGGLTASEAAGLSCAAAIGGGAILFFGTAGLGAVAAFSIGLAGCSGFGAAAISSPKKD